MSMGLGFAILLGFSGCGSGGEKPSEPESSSQPDQPQTRQPTARATAEKTPQASEPAQPGQGETRQQPGQETAEKPPQASDPEQPGGEKPPDAAAGRSAAGQEPAGEEPAGEEPAAERQRPPGTLKIPYLRDFPKGRKPLLPVRIALISSPNRPQVGARMGLILAKVQRRRLEREMNRQLRVVYVSRSMEKHGGKTLVRYRPDFLPAALKVASILPDRQTIEPMSEKELSRAGVDVIVYIGAGMR